MLQYLNYKPLFESSKEEMMALGGRIYHESPQAKGDDKIF